MERSTFFEGVHRTDSCRNGWHLTHTVEGEAIYFRRAGDGFGFSYVFGPWPRGEGTKLVECAPNESPWLCEACGTFVTTDTCFVPQAPALDI